MGAAWFKFFPKEYLTDSKVKMLTRIHRSMLIELWCYCSEDGSIPSDVESLAMLLGEPANAVANAMKKLQQFFVVEGDRLVSSRLRSEAHAYEDKCQKLKQNASKGGFKKVANAIANASPNGVAIGLADRAEAEAEAEKDKRIPPTKVGLSELDSTWLQRLLEGWPEKNHDGSATPYSAPGAVEKLFTKVLKSKKVTGEEVAWAAHLYTERLIRRRQYIVGLKTFLGPQGFVEAELDEARARIASQQVSA